MNKMEKTPTLKKDFPVADYEQWKAAAEQLLKGRPFEKTLFTQTEEGITLQPIYERSNAPDSGTPGEAPFTRGASKKAGWHVAQGLYCGAEQFNQTLKDVLKRGQDAVRLDLVYPAEIDPEYQGTLALKDTSQLEKLLEGSDPGLPVFANAMADAPHLADLFAAMHPSGSRRLLALGGDPLSAALWSGGLAEKLETSLDRYAGKINALDERFPHMKLFSLRSDVILEAGGHALQQLAYALALGAEYLTMLDKAGVKPERAIKQMRVQLAIGNDTFREIAKMRALRLLWSKMAAAFGLEGDLTKTAIDARTALRNKSYYDPWVNMLRVTGESFAAICGGCNSLEVAPFDAALGLPDDFARRIARNTQIVLREESHLAKVIDPAGGSAYIETLTMQLAEKAWALFQRIEAEGGITAALRKGWFQDEVKANAEKQLSELAVRKRRAIGSNIYPNLTEKRPEKAGRKIPSLKNLPISESFPALKPQRLLLPFEKMRRHVEAMKQKPQVLMAQVGKKARLKARSDFVRGFFEVAAFGVDDAHYFDSAADALEHALGAAADVVVLCASDEDYHEVVPVFAPGFREQSQRPLYLAGHPAENEQKWREAGIDGFVHLKSNVPDVLGKLLD